MRKLAIMSVAFSVGIFAANYIFSTAQLIPCSLILAALGVAALFFVPAKKKLTSKILFSAAFGIICFCGAYISKAAPADAVCAENVPIEIRATTYPSENKNYLKCEAMLVSDGLPKLKCVIYDYNALIKDIIPGNTYSLSADLSPADEMYGSHYDGYTSKNIFLILKPCSEPELICQGGALSALPVKFSAALCDIAAELFPDDCAAFIKSLLTGNRSDFYTQTGLKLDFGRAGLMHVVAISGMHISLLGIVLFFIFGRKRQNGVVCLVFIWFFVAAVGAPASAVRAAVMQSSLLIAPLVRRENDGITSLFTALAILLAINPYSCASVGLQLSFSAMLGIVIVGNRLKAFFIDSNEHSVFGRIKAYVLSTVASSLAATLFTLPLMLIHFGYVSLLAPITNILCLWAVTVCFAGGLICCLIGFIFPSVAALLAYIPICLSRFIFAVVGFAADIPHSVLYTSNPVYIAWFILVILLVFSAVFFKAGKTLRIILPLFLSGAALAAAVFFTGELSPAKDGMVSVLDVGQGQCIAIMSGNSTVLIDCGNISSPDDAGEIAKAYLESRGRDKIDALILTHLHADHSDGVESLLELEEVDIIYCQLPSATDSDIANNIADLASKKSCDVVNITDCTSLYFDDITIEMWPPDINVKNNERCMIIKASVRDYDVLITGDNPIKLEKAFAQQYDLSDIDALIVGHHGSKYSSSEELLSAVGGRTAIISVGYNSYGHPTYETLARLDEYGYNVYRTDLNGTIEISLN